MQPSRNRSITVACPLYSEVDNDVSHTYSKLFEHDGSEILRTTGLWVISPLCSDALSRTPRTPQVYSPAVSRHVKIARATIGDSFLISPRYLIGVSLCCGHSFSPKGLSLCSGDLRRVVAVEEKLEGVIDDQHYVPILDLDCSFAFKQSHISSRPKLPSPARLLVTLQEDGNLLCSSFDDQFGADFGYVETDLKGLSLRLLTEGKRSLLRVSDLENAAESSISIEVMLNVYTREKNARQVRITILPLGESKVFLLLFSHLQHISYLSSAFAFEQRFYVEGQVGISSRRRTRTRKQRWKEPALHSSKDTATSDEPLELTEAFESPSFISMLAEFVVSVP